MRTLFSVVLVLFASACSHPLEILGQGDITSSTGVNDCSLEQQPCENIVVDDYFVTYIAVPREGWRFVRWQGCGSQFPTCSYSLPGSIVSNFTDQTMPSLVAVFEPDVPVQRNILTIMVDDLGYNDLGINNSNAAIHTPNMNNLAREGTRFTRHYAAAVCSPARASFLTGLNPARLGYLPNGRGISPEIVTIAERLQQEGYSTWHIGKWHIGDLDRIAWPDHQGFDHWFGFLDQWRLAGVHVDGELQLAQPRYVDPWLESDSVPGQHYSGHLENILTDKAIVVLSDLNATQAPWFLNLWFYAPHSPISPANDFALKYPDTADGKYRALIEQLDNNVGRVLAHLKSLQALENTIVVLVSDNGGAFGRVENEDNNAPYFGFKSSLNEGSLRTPLIVRWPEGSLSGKVFSDTISIADLYPTILESNGMAVPDGLDGFSFFASIKGLEPAPQRSLFWEHVGSSYGVLSSDSRWRLYDRIPFWGVEVGPNLFDLEQDPTGSAKLASIPPLQLALMEDEYSSWYRDVHVVQTNLIQDELGVGELTGMDLLRTPGFGPYTFGVGIDKDFFGQLAAQGDIWSISRSSDTVFAEFGDMILSGDVGSAAGCHSVVVSGEFVRKLNHTQGPDSMRLTLYIDGQEVQYAEIEATLAVPDPTIATEIGDFTIIGNGVIFAPVVLNRSVDASSAWTVESFSDELCGVGSV